MAQDEQGIDPKAKDAVPNERSDKEQKVADDQLAMRRARQAERDAAEEKATGMSDHPKNGNGHTVDDQPPEPEPTAAELFPQGSIEGDHKLTMKNIVPGGKPRRLESKMGSTAIPMQHGLVAYGTLVRLIVVAEAGQVREVPELEEQDDGGQRKLLGVKDVQHFRPVHVGSAEGMFTLDQVLEILQHDFGIPKTSDKVQEVFGLKPPAAATG